MSNIGSILIKNNNSTGDLAPLRLPSQFKDESSNQLNELSNLYNSIFTKSISILNLRSKNISQVRDSSLTAQNRTSNLENSRFLSNFCNASQGPKNLEILKRTIELGNRNSDLSNKIKDMLELKRTDSNLLIQSIPSCIAERSNSLNLSIKITPREKSQSTNINNSKDITDPKRRNSENKNKVVDKINRSRMNTFFSSDSNFKRYRMSDLMNEKKDKELEAPILNNLQKYIHYLKKFEIKKKESNNIDPDSKIENYFSFGPKKINKEIPEINKKNPTEELPTNKNISLAKVGNSKVPLRVANNKFTQKEKIKEMGSMKNLKAIDITKSSGIKSLKESLLDNTSLEGCEDNLEDSNNDQIFSMMISNKSFNIISEKFCKTNN